MLFGSSAPSSGLTATYINQLIQDTLNVQRKPIRTLTAQKDQLNIKKTIYSDLKSELSTFEGIVEDLTSDGDTVFDNMEATSSDTDILTATATSSAASGNYTISVTNLAEAHMIRSDQQASSSEALNLSGTFTFNNVSIEVEGTDSLEGIMDAINNAEYEDGKEVTATIVDNHLVIEAASTGTSNQLTASDTTGAVLSDLGILDGGSFKTTLQGAEGATFTVNGIEIARESNTDLQDVISGLTLNLLGEGTDVELEISPDYTAIEETISTFVSDLNSTLEYLAAKTRTTIDQTSKTYTRGILAGETVFSMLRADLLEDLRTQITSGVEGAPEYLADIGITIGDGLEVSLDDSILNSALESNLEDVIQLFDGVMEKFLSTLQPFTTETSSSNTIDLYIDSVKTKIDNIDNRIERTEKLLETREKMLINRYSSLYTRNVQFTFTQQLLGIYFGFSTTA